MAPINNEHLSPELIAAYLNQAVSSHERQEVKQHLLICKDCRVDLAEASELGREPHRVRWIAGGIPAAAESAIQGELEQLGAATSTMTRRRRIAKFAGGIGVAAAAAAVAFLLVPDASQVEDPTTAPDHRGPVLTLRAPPVAVAPAGLVETPIQFMWTSVPGADRYELTLFDNTASILWDTQTTDTVVVVPDSVGLAPGSSYFWKAEALIGFDRWSESDLVEFRLVTRPDSTPG